MIQAPADARSASSVGHLWLTDFRVFREVDVELAPGLTVLYGSNGQGKTSLLEAIGWVARARPFRGVADAMLVRGGEQLAILRAEVSTGERQQLFEAEIKVSGRNRIQCNRQAITRARDLHGLLRVTVFAPDDLALVKAGPADRREYLDELLAMLAARDDAARSDYERVLKQRNALLRSGMRDPDARTTLDVFDEQLAQAGAEITRGRLRLLERLVPAIASAYQTLATESRPVDAEYTSEWAGGVLTAADADDLDVRLRAAIADRRRAEIDRGLTLVGPHRDELRLTIGGLDARHQASQGEQRTLALALRLAGHETVRDLTGAAPVLLLDDVFSERCDRTAALVHNLPPGQTLVTTAGVLPPDVVAERTLLVRDGTVGAGVKKRDEPVPLRDAMQSLTRQLGIPAPDQQASVDSVWPEVVGPVLAEHARVRSIHKGDCVVEVDGPAWATQLRYLGDALARGVNERCGRVLVTSVRIVVLRPGNTP